MSFYAFKLLFPVAQLYWVRHHGTFLANHWEDESGVNLCLPPSRLSAFVSLPVWAEALAICLGVSCCEAGILGL